MKAKFNVSEICGDCLSPGKGSFRSRVSKSLLTLILGLFLLSGMNRPGYLSFQAAMQLLETATAEHLESLVTDTQPTAYLTNGEITTSGGAASIVATCDAASVNMLYENNPALSHVELVKFTVSSPDGLPASIDLKQLEELASLKFVLVEFAYEACAGNTEGCLNSILWGIIAGTSSQIIVIFSPSILP